MDTSKPGIGLIEIDQRIIRLAEDGPGIAQPEIVKNLQREWSPSNIRQRIELLAAREAVRTERYNGRVFVYPADETRTAPELAAP